MRSKFGSWNKASGNWLRRVVQVLQYHLNLTSVLKGSKKERKMSDNEVPLSPAAQDAKEMMQQELLRNVAKKMMVAAEEEERQRRVEELSDVHKSVIEKEAYEQLMIVQEDLIRTMNLMKVNTEMELEKAQRETETKKAQVHDELLRKSAAKKADKAMDEEKDRREKEGQSELDAEKKEVYGKLVIVQEDLLKTLRKIKVDEEVKLEQERRELEGHKKLIHEELFHTVNERVAKELMENERKRRVEGIGENEIQRRVAIANRMLDVQKELLATHKEVKSIRGTVSQAAMEEAKAFYQEQLVRKAAQKEAIAAMEKEKERRISESDDHVVSDSQATVLEEITRKSNIKKAKEQADNTQREYIQAEAKARAQEETVRKVNQKAADLAMDKEKAERVKENTRKPLDKAIKKDIESHSSESHSSE